jgi:hypothetical protein
VLGRRCAGLSPRGHPSGGGRKEETCVGLCRDHSRREKGEGGWEGQG